MDNLKNVMLENLVRKLRIELFYRDVYSEAHEREWETEEKQKDREEWNRVNRIAWEKETEEMIRSCYDKTATGKDSE